MTHEIEVNVTLRRKLTLMIEADSEDEAWTKIDDALAVRLANEVAFVDDWKVTHE